MVKQGLAEVIDSIKEESHDSVILVEGKRDKEALIKGMQGLNTKRNFSIDEIAFKVEDLLLTSPLRIANEKLKAELTEKVIQR